jgi:hypothetical protein
MVLVGWSGGGVCVRGEGVGFQACSKLLRLERPDAPAQRLVAILRHDIPRNEERVLSIFGLLLPGRRVRGWSCDRGRVGKGRVGGIARLDRRRSRRARGV